MFYRQINEDIAISISIPQYAKELFALTDKNRDYLKQWLPWLNTIAKPSDTKEFIQLQLQRFAKTEALHATLFYRGKIAGVLAYNQIDQKNGIGHLGYWLGKEYTGKGIMFLAVQDMLALGFTDFSLQKVEIRCATGNHKSRAIPEKLNFHNEGTLRKAEKVNDKWFDHVVYGLLREELEGQK